MESSEGGQLSLVRWKFANEVEVEVDYTPLDHARDAVDSLGTWSDVAAWPRSKDDALDDVSPSPSALASPAFAAEATRAFSAAPSGALPMAPVSGLAVAFAFAVGAAFGRRSAESKSADECQVVHGVPWLTPQP